jgi:hypothetical protein
MLPTGRSVEAERDRTKQNVSIDNDHDNHLYGCRWHINVGFV